MTRRRYGALLAPYLPAGVIATVCLAGVFLFFLYRRKRLVEVVVAVTMSLLLVLSPVLSTLPLLRFLGVQRAQAVARESAEAEVDIAESLRAFSAENTFDPHANLLEKLAERQAAAPLAAVAAALADEPTCLATGGADDPDGDGLPTAEEGALLPPTNANVADSDGDGLSDCVEVRVWHTAPFSTTLDSNGVSLSVDTDRDGIGDFQELGLGTDPHSADSDNDGIDDLVEIQGYSDPHDPAAPRWFSDPLTADTNQDGIGDLIELGAVAGVAGDSDGDRTPDLYDMDNDGDGVPDGTDLSAFSPVSPAADPANLYATENPLQFSLNGIEPGRTAYLDLQLRPVDATHLRYAYTVLDWPVDKQGQVQEWDNRTFAQNLQDRGYVAAAATGPAADSYGDMRLTPNLEITIEGTDGVDLSAYHLPPQAELEPYTINVITTTVDGTATGTPNGIKLYVPLSLVTDAKSGARVAFRARIPYLGTGAPWTALHKMRMVWTVTMLTDIPCDPTDSEAVTAGCKTYDGSNARRFTIPATFAATLDAATASAELTGAFAAAGHALAAPVVITPIAAGSHWQVKDKTRVYTLRLQAGVINVYATTPGLFFNQAQIVQTYDDAWYLTGANVTEDHGAAVAVVYEDPAVDPDLHSDDCTVDPGLCAGGKVPDAWGRRHRSRRRLRRRRNRAPVRPRHQRRGARQRTLGHQQ